MTVMLDIVRHRIKDLNGHLPKNKTIWKAIRHRDLSRKIREFLWKTMHSAHHIGK